MSGSASVVSAGVGELWGSAWDGVVLLGAPGAPAGGAIGGGGAVPTTGDSAPLGTTGADGAGGPGTQSPPPGAGIFDLLLPMMLGLFVVMIVMQVMAGRKQKRQREDLLGALKKHDVVQTSGGMIGTIVELKDDEVLLKIDAETNTRARFARSAVQNVVRSAQS